MIAKLIEVRDRATFIPMLAIRLNPGCEADRYLLARAGYGTTSDRQGEYVILAEISGGGGRAFCDPYEWANRTHRVAHHHVTDNFETIASGDVVDVEYILGETLAPKRSEREEPTWPSSRA